MLVFLYNSQEFKHVDIKKRQEFGGGFLLSSAVKRMRIYA
jgi:hypothetical protein